MTQSAREWRITSHALERFRERIGWGDERTIQTLLRRSRPPSRLERRKILGEAIRIGGKAPSRALAEDGAYLAVASGVAFVCVNPRRVVTCYRVPP